VTETVVAARPTLRFEQIARDHDRDHVRTVLREEVRAGRIERDGETYRLVEASFDELTLRALRSLGESDDTTPPRAAGRSKPMTTTDKSLVSSEGDLSTIERDRLADLEAIVERGLQTFVEVGLALAEIRDARLYRTTHPSFEAYCAECWRFGDRRARQLIATAEIGTMVPVANERQARELLPLADDEAGLVEVYGELRERHGEGLTAAVIRERVRSKNGRAASGGPSNTRVEIGKVGDKLVAARASLDRLLRRDPVLGEAAREQARRYAADAREMADLLDGLADGEEAEAAAIPGQTTVFDFEETPTT
jgi:hypothetical protein